jgi:putative ABC transport system permease protein
MRPTAEAYPRQTHPFLTLGRLAPGADPETAQEELSAIAADLEATYPENEARGVNLEAYSDVVFGPVRSALLLLLGAVALVLLVACANVANLLLAESSVRMREVAVRQAFGASDGLIRRQFLVESLLLTGLGTVAGVALAYGGLDLMVAFAPDDLPRLSSAELDLRVLAFTAGLGGAVAVLFGLLPSIQSRGLDLQGILKGQGSTRGTEGRAVRRYRSGLVVAEIALAVALVVGAGILVRSFWELQAVDLGFGTAGILKAEYELPSSQYSGLPEINDFHQRFLERARQIPGVEAAAVAAQHPLDPGFTNSFTIVGREAQSRDHPEIRTRFISPGYLDVVRLPLLEGRAIEDGDLPDGPKVGVINQTAASRYFGDAGAVGQEMRFWGQTWRVMGDERFRGPDRENEPAIYVSTSQLPWPRVTVLLRSDLDAPALTVEAGRILRELDPGLVLFDPVSLTSMLQESVSRPRFTATLLGLFAGLAMLLAMIGVYGVLNYAVVRRAPEVGIRLALGASRGDVFKEVVGEGLRVTALGAALGAAMALATSRLLQGLVFGISATDGTTYAVVIGLVLSAAVLASTFPALRASRTNPVALLKAE